MNKWVKFYEDVMGFRNLISFDDKDISTEYSSLMSKVVANGNDRIKFPINEPAQGQEEVADRRVPGVLPGPGVQHMAHRHRRHHRDGDGAAGPRRRVPPGADDVLRRRCWTAWARSTKTWPRSQELGILVDRDDEGYLLQIFTKPVQDRPTLVLRDHPAQGRQELRQGELQGAVRSDRAGAGAARESVREANGKR